MQLTGTDDIQSLPSIFELVNNSLILVNVVAHPPVRPRCTFRAALQVILGTVRLTDDFLFFFYLFGFRAL